VAVELREITSQGTYGEILPDWSDLTFSQDLLNPGALTFGYPVNGRNARVLTHGATLTTLVDGEEPINSRFTYYEGEGARLGDAESSVVTYACTSTLSRATKMMLAPAFGSTVADADMFAYVAKTPGWLVRTAIEDSMSRARQRTGDYADWLDVPVRGFSDTLDSSGAAWPAVYDVTFPPTTTVQGVIDWLVQYGFAEAQMVGKELRLYCPSNNGRDLTSGTNPIALQTGRDFLEATYRTTSTDLVNALLVLGDNNACAWVYDTDSITTYGYREGALTVSNASQQATLIAAGNAFLTTRAIPRYSYTYSVSALYLERTNANPRPFIDYQVGDSVLILDGAATAVQRIRLLSAQWPDARASTVNLTVNDWLAERDVELDRRVSRLGLAS
jgi:hypothetical protein